MNVAVIPNMSKNNVSNIMEQVIKKLVELGASVLVEEQYKHYFSNFECCFFYGLEELFIKCDFVLSIGGDGTLIHTAKKAAKFNRPVLGINVGRLGFVASIEVDELYRLDDLINKEYIIQNRMMLEVTVTEGDITNKFYALNDIVISKGEFSRIIDVDVFIGGMKVCEHRSDGVIIATPTGSTAYSLSAGGPIVDPCMNCILLTPICSHLAFSKPQIFSSDTELVINTKFSNGCSAFLTVDGDKVIEISDKTVITVKKSDITARLILFKDESFYKILSKKFLNKRFGM